MSDAAVGVLVLYFGRWPRFFRFFLETCRHNPQFDFIIIGDCGKPEGAGIPPNCSFLPMTLKDLSRRASAALGLRIELTYAYKVCDLKPALGRIFEQELMGYEFWGYSDIDVLFGNMGAFLTPEVRAAHDALFVRKEYTTGSLFLMRNMPAVNDLFRRSPDHGRVFEDATRNYEFDECAGVYRELIAGQSIFDVPTPIVSFTEVVRAAEREGAIRAYFDAIALEGLQRHAEVRMREGRLLCGDKEYALYHSVCEKSSPLFTFPNWGQVPPDYNVTRLGVFGVLETPSVMSIVINRGNQVLEHVAAKLRKGYSRARRGNWRAIVRHLGLTRARSKKSGRPRSGNSSRS